ncbi:MAG: COX15/CtaA family protein, partial [Phycisphaerae bacterium]
HAHRLFGTLVGLTTLSLALYLQRYEPNRKLRGIGWFLFLLVCVQGVLGGLRVTGRFTMSQSHDDVAPSIALAVVHGVFGQIFYASLVVLAVLVSRRWKSVASHARRELSVHSPAASLLLVAAIILQIILGAVFRHLGLALTFHVVFAAFVLALACFVGFRAWMRDDALPVLPKYGGWLMMAATLQLLLGVLALIGVMVRRGAESPPALEVILTTAHQTFGAVLLALAVAFACWNVRLRKFSTAENDSAAHSVLVAS